MTDEAEISFRAPVPDRERLRNLLLDGAVSKKMTAADENDFEDLRNRVRQFAASE